jgi:hypothetical protein
VAINSYYPKDYFDLPGVDSIGHPSQLWWSSQERPAIIDGSASVEHLEIDFGRIREVNYMAFDIVKKPIDIRIFYDATSFDDGSHTWIEVKRLPDLAQVPFDSRIDFDGSTNPWKHSEFYFHNALNENIIATRFLRIQFTRRSDVWPTPTFPASIWSIDVANLRTARYITNLDDTRGVLFSTTTPTPIGEFETNSLAIFSEFRQPFTMPTGYARGDNGINVRDPVITPIVPNIVGFGFLVDVKQPSQVNVGDTNPSLDDVSFNWEFQDITDGTPQTIKSGTQVAASNVGKCWIDVIFDSNDPVPTTQNSKFQFNIRSNNLHLVENIYTRSPNPLGSDVSTDYQSVSVDLFNQQFIRRVEDSSLVYRVWADIGETGKDVLGNQYREGVRRDSAANVADNTSNTAWFSMPSPSPEGVECLYFDVRTRDSSGNLIPTIMDSIEIDPATPGSYMHIYYSNEGTSLSNNPVPQQIEDWENLLWTPIQSTFILDKNHVYDLPRPIRASWICLEFSNLQPVPYPLPEIPELPAIQYKTYPQWLKAIFATNSTFRGDPTTTATIVNGTQQVRGNIFDDNFTVKDEFTINSRIISEEETAPVFPTNSSTIDPVTLAQISLNTPRMWTGNIAANATGGIFANYIAANAASGGTNFPSEILPPSNTPSIKRVSTIGDNSSVSFAELATDPIFFDRVCRHTTGEGGYKLVQAKFNKKAYYVGVANVRFFRKDYTVERDDPVIHDILAESNFIDSPLIELSTWTRETPSNILAGQTVYITYTINGVVYTDEPIQFERPDQDISFAPVILFNGGGRASNVQLRSGPFGTGTGYTTGIDYDVAYDPETFTNSILRNSLHWRLIATRKPVSTDDAVIIGRGFPIGVEIHEMAPEGGTVIGIGSATTAETFSNVVGLQFIDSDTVTGDSELTSDDFIAPHDFVDADTLISAPIFFADEIAPIHGTDYVDAGNVLGDSVNQISASEIYGKTFTDSGITNTTGQPPGREAYTRLGIPGIVGLPPQLYTSTSFPTTLKPIFWPYMPTEVKSLPVSSLRTKITFNWPGSLAMYIYTYNYTAARVFTAQFVAMTDIASTNTLGFLQIPILGGPISLDFNVNKYMLGLCIDSSTPASLAVSGTGGDSGGVIFTSAISAVDTIPTTFSQTDVSPFFNKYYMAMITQEGERYI